MKKKLSLLLAAVVAAGGIGLGGAVFSKDASAGYALFDSRLRDLDDQTSDNQRSAAGDIEFIGLGTDIAEAYNSVKVVVNNTELTGDSAGVIVDGRTLVPVRAVSETVGAEVSWDGGTRTATVKKDGKTISIPIDSYTIYSGGSEVSIDVPAQIINDRTMLPLRAVGEQLGLEVGWDGDSRTAYLGSVPSVSGGKTLVAQPLANSFNSDTISGDKLQSLVEYCDGRLKFKGQSTSDGNVNQTFSGKKEDIEVVEEYINLICGKGTNFKVIDTSEFEYKKYANKAWAINYTGDKRVPRINELMFKDDVECDISIYYVLEYGSIDVKISVPEAIEIADLGYRYGASKSEKLDKTPSGGSVLAGLYRNSDGSYETSDGRLHAQVGQAMLIRNGETMFVPATYRIDMRDGHDHSEELSVDDYYRTESMVLMAPYHQYVTGDIIRYGDYDNGSWQLSDGDSDPRHFKAYSPGRFGLKLDGKWIYPYYSSSYYEDFTARVMYYSSDEAVFYIYAKINKEPYEIEALCAVDLTNAVDDGSNDGEKYTINVAQDINLTAASKDYQGEYRDLTNWNTYKWEITEGADCITLDGEVSATCSIHGVKPGTAKVKLVHEWGEDYEDALTKIRRRGSKSETVIYTITVQ